MIHTLLVLFIVLCIFGVILWGIGRIPGIPEIAKTVIYVLAAVLILVWLLSMVNGATVSLR